MKEIVVELTDLGLSETTLVNHLRRSSRAHQRYLLTCQKQDVKADPAVEHQLMNHVLLLQMVANATGRDESLTEADIKLGAAQARSEI